MLSYYYMITQCIRTTIPSLFGIALLSLLPSLSNSAVQLPTLPQATIDTTYSPPNGNTITVNAGDNFQTALNNANLGDTIVLQAGATFTGPFILPNKTSGAGWIYIRSSNYSKLPASGQRVNPDDAINMPKILATSSGAIQTATTAHHYRFVGIEVTLVSGTFTFNVITIGNSDISTNTLPHDITFDRCYIHGDPTVGSRRGVAMNGVRVAVVDSYVSDFKQQGSDTQALWAYNTPGPLKITNNYLEAAGENVMFGGADSQITNLVPSDIEIKHNYFFKPLSWIGSQWSVKNHLEFKNAQRVLVEGNLFENVWRAAQGGVSLLITPRNQDGTAPWCVVQDITVRLNRFINVGAGLGISGRDGNQSQIMNRGLFQNNVFQVKSLNGSSPKILSIQAGPKNITIDHNTGFSATSFGSFDNIQQGDGFVYTNNIMTYGNYGFGSSQGEGTIALNGQFTNWTFANNASISDPYKPSNYPSNNFFPATIMAVGFVNYEVGDYHLSASSPYKNVGTDGLDLGADIDAIANASTGVAGNGPLSPLSSPPYFK